jgi:hypothetical protein
MKLKIFFEGEHLTKKRDKTGVMKILSPALVKERTTLGNSFEGLSWLCIQNSELLVDRMSIGFRIKQKGFLRFWIKKAAKIRNFVFIKFLIRSSPFSRSRALFPPKVRTECQNEMKKQYTFLGLEKTRKDCCICTKRFLKKYVILILQNFICILQLCTKTN